MYTSISASLHKVCHLTLHVLMLPFGFVFCQNSFRETSFIVGSETIVSLYFSSCTKGMKEENGSIGYSVLHLSCLTGSPLRRTLPPPPRAWIKSISKQQKMGIRLTAPQNMCPSKVFVESLVCCKTSCPVWDAFFIITTWGVSKWAAEKEEGKDAGCYDMWWLLSHLSLRWQRCNTHQQLQRNLGPHYQRSITNYLTENESSSAS